MVIVKIEKSGDMTLGKWFSKLRSWFDHNHCQPTLFNQSEKKRQDHFQYHLFR